MTITNVTAIEWSVNQDLSSPLTAAGFTAKYDKVNGQLVWDPSQYNNIKLFSGETNPDLVRIKATYDGVEQEVILGVVDRSGRAQGATGVLGTLVGRDRLALALDGYPAVASSLQGITVDPVSNSHIPQKRYTEAVSELASAAGLSVLFSIGTDDYAIGKTIPVTTDQTFGEMLAQLLEPWRLSDRYAHDAWVEGTTLRVVRRDLAAGTVQVEYERLEVTNYGKSRLPAVNAVRIEGADYEVLVADPDAVGGCPGIRNTAISFVGIDAETSYTETEAQHYNALCQLVLIVRNRVYGDLKRSEVWTTTMTYLDDPDSAAHGQKVTEIQEHRVTDSREGNAFLQDLASKKTTVWSYYEDNGDVATEDVLEQRFGKEVDSIPTDGKKDRLDESKRILTSYRYVRSAGQLFRFWDTTETDAIKKKVTHESGQSEVGPFKVGAQSGSVVPFGKKQESRQIVCGPANARRVESNDLIGDAVAACLIQTRVAEDHNRIRLDITARMLPDHNVKVGRILQIQNAPAWYDTSSFYIIASTVRATERGATQELRGVAWLAVPP